MHTLPTQRSVSALLAFCLFGASATAHAGSPVVTFNVSNSGMTAWIINGQTNPPLTLVRGHTYAFNMQNVGASHPFNINTINTPGSNNRYNDGVTNNGASGNTTLTFVVPANAPASLHYNCGNHTNMNAPITILTDEIFATGFD